MKTLIAACLAGLVSAGAAFALDADVCDVPPNLLFSDAELNIVNAAVTKNRKLDVVVIGTGSSLLGGGDGADKSYPARLEAALRKRLPGVAVKVKPYVKPRQTTEDMALLLDKVLSEEKPDLLVWQAGTVDAIRGVDPDRFRAILDESVNTVRAVRFRRRPDEYAIQPAHRNVDCRQPVCGQHALGGAIIGACRCSTVSPSCAIGAMSAHSICPQAPGISDWLSVSTIALAARLLR